METLTPKDIKKYCDDIIEGFHSGIPECCILRYIYDLSNNLEPLVERQNTFPYLIFPDWVPCEKHCGKFMKYGLPLWAKKLPKENGYFFLEYDKDKEILTRKRIFEVLK